jgi:hypothetical protein
MSRQQVLNPPANSAPAAKTGAPVAKPANAVVAQNDNGAANDGGVSSMMQALASRPSLKVAKAPTPNFGGGAAMIPAMPELPPISAPEFNVGESHVFMAMIEAANNRMQADTGSPDSFFNFFFFFVV